MSDTNLTEIKKKLRSQVRAKRQALSTSYRDTASHQMIEQFKTLSLRQGSAIITGFFPHDGELNIEPLMDYLAESGCKVAVPVIDFASNLMQFQLIDSNTQFVLNRYGIKEPVWNTATQVQPDSIDIVLYPLVAFDHKCRRLGMGGGYYDKYFSFLNSKSDDSHRHEKKSQQATTLLIGCGFECQKIESVPVEHWDIELDHVLTESFVYSRDK